MSSEYDFKCLFGSLPTTSIPSASRYAWSARGILGIVMLFFLGDQRNHLSGGGDTLIGETAG